jgi:hypothetical protein
MIAARKIEIIAGNFQSKKAEPREGMTVLKRAFKPAYTH